MIMRFKKGSTVEVLSKNEVPSGSWRCAEIICGNGHNYTVRYEMDPGATDKAIVERVSRKSIRPCPPPVELLENCVPGDVVEVFQNFSWKMAIVSKVLGRNYFFVRLLGSSHEFKVSKFDLRVRQSWQGDKWFVIGKGVGNFEDGKCSEWSTVKYNQKLSSQVKKTDRGMKRGLPNCYSQDDAPARTAQKFRVIEKEGRCHRLLAANPSPLPEKGRSRRLVHLASKFLMMLLGFATFSCCRQWFILGIKLTTNRRAYDELMDVEPELCGCQGMF